MLRRLRGRTHEVITGVAVVDAATGRDERSAVVSTIRLRDVADADIAAYVATGEPLDKAGSYAVQGAGGALVEAVDGCYANVVGLPLALELPDRAAAFFWIGGPGEAMLGLWSLGSAPLGLSLHLAFTASLDDVLGACGRLRSLGVTPLSFHATETDEPRPTRTGWPSYPRTRWPVSSDRAT